MKKRNNLAKERKYLEDHLAYLREKKMHLLEYYDSENRIYEQALEKGDANAADLALKGLSRTEKMIEQTEEEYNNTFQHINQCSQTGKTDSDKFNGIIGTAAVVGGTAGSWWLAKNALDRAYESDVNGSMVHKKVLDFFNRINPTKILGFTGLKK